MSLYYVDSSSNNGTPNVAKYAAAGHRKLSVKVSEGAGYHWYGGEGVIDEAHRLGLVVEHYHWLRPDQDAIAQAKFFLGWVGKRFKPGDNAMTDFELTYQTPDGSDSHRAQQLAAFNEYVAARVGRPYTYTGNWYLAEKGPLSQAECRRWPVVMSDYSGATTLPNPYGLHYVAWQFTSRALVAGFTSPVDYNRTLTAPTGTGTGTGAGTDSGAHHPIVPPTTPTSHQETATMYEIIYDQATQVWYAWAPGFWHRFTSSAELQFMANRAGCLNGAAVRRVLAATPKNRAKALDAFGFGNAHTVLIKHFAKG